ncbi:NADPH:quinone reductase [Mycobacterium goodii]|nr:NADPH:quinone reductase [Mycolicibacterium goodii]
MEHIRTGELHEWMIGGVYAIEVAETGGPEVLNYVERSEPSPGPGEVLIKADAIGVNFIDTYFRSGLYPRELPFVVGSEVCGTVAAIGNDVAALKVGDRVVTANAVGAYADYCVAPADFVAYVPDGVAPEAVASALLKGMTAHYLLKSTYPVQPSDTILVHAGAGGVGLILTQWATSLGTRVITTASTPEKAELSRQAGAVEVLEYPNPDDPQAFASRVRELTGGAGVSAVYDGVGATTFDASLASLAVRGTLALFGASSGPVPPVDPQRLNQAGSVFLTRPTLAHHTRTADEFSWRAGELINAIADGSIKITVGGKYALAEASQAHTDLQNRKTVGSIVLIP